MKKNTILLVISLLLLFFSTSCDRLIQTVEVTRLVPQTVEVTKVIFQTVIPFQTSNVTITETKESDLTSSQKTPQVVDSAYYQGIIVISQYYTFLSQGLYQEAYQLLSTNAKVYPLEEYIKNQKSAFTVLKIISIQPFFIQPNQNRSTPEPKTNKWFIVAIYAEGEGGMSGSVPNGDQSFYMEVTQENGMWKIYKWATGIAP